MPPKKTVNLSARRQHRSLNSCQGHQSRPEDVAAALDVLASRVRRMSPPLARYPDRFHEERSDIAKDIANLARRVSPRNRPRSGVTVDVSEIRRGRIITTGQTVNGRRIVVQKRRAFAVYVGEGPVKGK